MAVTPVAFYAVSNEEHFLGLVGLLNSLRLRGHKEPLLVADCGLAAWQLEALAPHAEVVAVDRETSPYMLKTSLPRERPAWKMVLLDADLLVLRPLTPILEEQAAVVAFADPVAHRFHPEWADLLDVPPIRRGPYVNSGLLVLSGDIGRSILDLVAGKQKRVDTATTRAEGGRPSSPFYYSDQDVWNAVLASSVDPGELVVLPAELAPHPPFTASAGQEPYVLHHVDRKPWLHSTRANAYSRLFPRLLLGDDVALRLEPAQVPSRFRAGTVARLDRLRAEASALAYGLRGRVGLRRRLAERRDARA